MRNLGIACRTGQQLKDRRAATDRYTIRTHQTIFLLVYNIQSNKAIYYHYQKKIDWNDPVLSSVRFLSKNMSAD
jgi:hypothetical protein